MRDLVTHVGTGHRWAAEIVEGRLHTPPPQLVREAPQDRHAWAPWLIDGARRLAHAVRDGGPDRPVWTWRAERPAGFWLRKLLHDALIHRFDVELAAGHLGAVAPEVAADGVSDLLASIAALSQPGSGDPIFRDLAGTGEALQFQATDPGLAGAEWLVDRTPAGVARSAVARDAVSAVRPPARRLWSAREAPNVARARADRRSQMVLDFPGCRPCSR